MVVTMPSPTRAMIVSSPAPPTRRSMLARTVTRAVARSWIPSLATAATMGQVALPELKRAGYAGGISTACLAAGGKLGILIPPSVMLIVYGATAGVSVVKLYAGAFFPGIMLATLYVIYVVVIAKIKPSMAPPMSAEDRIVPLPPFAQVVSTTVSNKVLPSAGAALTASTAMRPAAPVLFSTTPGFLL